MENDVSQMKAFLFSYGYNFAYVPVFLWQNTILGKIQ